MVILTNVIKKFCNEIYQLLEELINSKLVFFKWLVHKLQNHFKVEGRPTDFNITKDENFIDMVSDSLFVINL